MTPEWSAGESTDMIAKEYLPSALVVRCWPGFIAFAGAQAMFDGRVASYVRNRSPHIVSASAQAIRNIKQRCVSVAILAQDASVRRACWPRVSTLDGSGLGTTAL